MILYCRFFSLENLRVHRTTGCVIAASPVRKEIKAIFSITSRSVDRADNVKIYEGQPMFCKHVLFPMEELELQDYFYHEVRRESEERSDLHRNVMERRKRIEEIQAEGNAEDHRNHCKPIHEINHLQDREQRRYDCGEGQCRIRC